MNPNRSILLVAACLAGGLLTACSQGSSPTEPSVPFDSSAKSLSASAPASAPVSATVAFDKRGGGNDDGSSDDNGGGGSNSGSGSGGHDDGNVDDHGDDGAGPAPTPEPTPDHRRHRNHGANDDNPQQQPPANRARAEFEGAVTAVQGGTILLAGGQRVAVDGQTVFSPRGDLRSLAALSQAVASNRSPRVEGRGTRQADGAILAASIKAEID